MSSVRKVLVITEGKDDKWFVNKILALFDSRKHEVFVFKTDVYQLYGYYKNADCDFRDLDVQMVLKSSLKQLTEADKSILNSRYTDIFLIFDFDPHADLYGRDKLIHFLKHFSDSTEYGKLLINYPMLESFRHFPEKLLSSGALYDPFLSMKFYENELRKEGGRQSPYKARAKTEGFSKKSLEHIEWMTLIINHLEKIRRLVGCKWDDTYEQANLMNLFEIQEQKYLKDREAYVVNTTFTVILELYPSKIFRPQGQ